MQDKDPHEQRKRELYFLSGITTAGLILLVIGSVSYLLGDTSSEVAGALKPGIFFLFFGLIINAWEKRKYEKKYGEDVNRAA